MTTRIPDSLKTVKPAQPVQAPSQVPPALDPGIQGQVQNELRAIEAWQQHVNPQLPTVEPEQLAAVDARLIAAEAAYADANAEYNGVRAQADEANAQVERAQARAQEAEADLATARERLADDLARLTAQGMLSDTAYQKAHVAVAKAEAAARAATEQYEAYKRAASTFDRDHVQPAAQRLHDATVALERARVERSTAHYLVAALDIVAQAAQRVQPLLAEREAALRRLGSLLTATPDGGREVYAFRRFRPIDAFAGTLRRLLGGLV